MNDGRNIAIYMICGSIAIGALYGWKIGLMVLLVWVVMLRKR